MATPKKKVPKFRNEDGEREFWGKTDSTEYLDWGAAKQTILPELKPTTKTISLRLPAMLLLELKSMANERDVPYQSLLKVLLAEKIAETRKAPNKPAA